jgi:hypothetical protein
MNVKMLRIMSGKACAVMLGITVFASCSKDVNNKTTGIQQQSEWSLQESSSVAIADSSVIKFFRAPFSSRGSRTDFRGEVSDTTAVISLDFFMEKKFKPGIEQRLLLDYADGGLSKKGWQYEVIIDRRTGTIKLIPNSIMEAQIVPGSFKTVVATYDKYTNTFTFLTEAKEANNNLVHQVTEIITKQ